MKKKHEEDGLRKAVHTHLKQIVSRPLTQRSLLELEKTARTARELLLTSEDPVAAPKKLLGAYINTGTIDYPDGSPMPNPVGSMGPETYGATVIRELVGAFNTYLKPSKNEPKESVLELVAAISLAREKGLDDLSAKLEAMLPKDNHVLLALPKKTTNGHAKKETKP